MTSQAVTPTEPRKCPICGTKLIPAAQAFSEIRERITAEEPPAELEQAIYDVVACVLAGEVEISDAKPESIRREFFPFHAERVNAAIESLRALFDRQREEIKERDEAFGTLDDAYNELIDQVASLSSQLERLKASQLTAEEAQHALDQIPDNQCGWPPKDCPVCDSLREKLRRQSDTGAHP